MILAPLHEFQFACRDGLRIACVRWDSRGTVRAVVHIAHGMGEHIRRYLDTIEVLLSTFTETIIADTAAVFDPWNNVEISERGLCL